MIHSVSIAAETAKETALTIKRDTFMLLPPFRKTCNFYENILSC